MEIQCSFCSQRILVDASMAGQVFACPHCGQSLQMAPAPAPVTPAPVTPAPVAPAPVAPAPVAPTPFASVPVATPVAPPSGAARVEPIPQNPFAIAKDLQPARRSSSGRGSRRGSRHAPSGGEGLAISSLVLGIVSLVLFCVPIVGIICGIIGLVLGLVANSRPQKNGMATAGIVMSIIGLALPILYIVFWGAAIASVF